MSEFEITDEMVDRAWEAYNAAGDPKARHAHWPSIKAALIAAAPDLLAERDELRAKLAETEGDLQSHLWAGQRVTETEAERDRLREAVRELVEALEPFAKIERSSFYGRDEDEWYCATLGDPPAKSTMEFTGQDIERARKVIAKHGAGR